MVSAVKEQHLKLRKSSHNWNHSFIKDKSQITKGIYKYNFRSRCCRGLTFSYGAKRQQLLIGKTALKAVKDSLGKVKPCEKLVPHFITKPALSDRQLQLKWLSFYTSIKLK